MVSHIVYSDGLAAVSVFIEPLPKTRPAPEPVPPGRGQHLHPAGGGSHGDGARGNTRRDSHADRQFARVQGWPGQVATGSVRTPGLAISHSNSTLTEIDYAQASCSLRCSFRHAGRRRSPVARFHRAGREAGAGRRQHQHDAVGAQSARCRRFPTCRRTIRSTSSSGASFRSPGRASANSSPSRSARASSSARTAIS